MILFSNFVQLESAQAATAEIFLCYHFQTANAKL